jgi:hypothetical protein
MTNSNKQGNLELNLILITIDNQNRKSFLQVDV